MVLFTGLQAYEIHPKRGEYAEQKTQSLRRAIYKKPFNLEILRHSPKSEENKGVRSLPEGVA